MGNEKTKNGQMNKETKFKKLVDYMRTLQGNGFTGYIKVNFSQGNIGRIEKFEEVLKHAKKES
jgi:hypothetical protein